MTAGSGNIIGFNSVQYLIHKKLCVSNQQDFNTQN